MWSHTRDKRDRIPPVTSCLRFKTQASFAPTQDGTGLLFDECEKRHYRLNSTYFFVARTLAADRGHSRFVDLVRACYPEAQDHDVTHILHALWGTHLLEEQHFLVSSPPLPLVAEFILLNICSQLQLKILGWKHVVAPLRLKQVPRSGAVRTTALLPEPSLLMEQVLAAAMVSYGIPGVSALCVPVALTLYRMLKRRGEICYLILGSPPSPLLPHCWVEIDGYRIDTVIYQFGENRYQACDE